MIERLAIEVIFKGYLKEELSLSVGYCHVYLGTVKSFCALNLFLSLVNL